MFHETVCHGDAWNQLSILHVMLIWNPLSQQVVAECLQVWLQRLQLAQVLRCLKQQQVALYLLRQPRLLLLFLLWLLRYTENQKE